MPSLAEEIAMARLRLQQEGSPQQVMGISWPPAPEGRNLLTPNIPGTRMWTKALNEQINDMPWPSMKGNSESLLGLLGLAPMAFTAYHGSPYTFSKVDMSKVGMGQGAQSFGHGFYAAENQKVAAKYYEELGPGRGIDPADIAKRVLDGTGGDKGRAIEELLRRKARAKSPEFDKTMDQAIASLNTGTGMGGLYKVDISPSSEKFLDWDKPLSKQPEQYRTALNDLAGKTKKSFPNIKDDATLGEFYRAYSSHRGGNDAAVSQELADLGIPGIRYLDQGSRGAGKGTYNYVVFSDKDVKILERK